MAFFALSIKKMIRKFTRNIHYFHSSWIKIHAHRINNFNIMNFSMQGGIFTNICCFW